MEFIQNKKLKTIREDWRGNPFDGKEFQYVDQAFRPSFKALLRWQTSRNPQAKEKRKDQWRPAISLDDHYLQSKEDFIVWLGHASFLIQLNGKRIITDPVFYNIAILKRLVPLPFDLQNLKQLDYLLLSHDHRDHCDKKTFKNLFSQIQPTTLTSLKMSKVMASWTKGNEIQEAGWYQQYQLPHQDLRITYLPTRHWCRRGLLDFNRVLWGSFMIETDQQCIYFGGDSASGNHFAEIAQLFPRIDIAILGIGAYKPDYMMEDVHANPAEALEAFQQLQAKKMIPMHYGTYDLSDEPISEPYHWIKRAFAEAGLSEALILPAVGEVVNC